VYNILEHKKEQDRIIVEDLDEKDGFIFLPDLKWDGCTKETLYCTAICMNRDIKSIRDLNETHIPMLTNIRDKCLKAIKEKYDVDSNQIRAYFHYQPSYYHLHVHFNYLKFDAPGIFCDRAHLLDCVISNIKMMPDFYQKATLKFTLRETDSLCEAFLQNEK
jgi:m7GpppX diphosphatase